MWNYLFSIVLPSVVTFLKNEATFAINALTNIFTKASADLGATEAIVDVSDELVKSEIIVLANLEGAVDALFVNGTALITAIKNNNTAEQAAALTALETDMTKAAGIWQNQKSLIESYLASVLKEVLVIKNTGI